MRLLTSLTLFAVCSLFVSCKGQGPLVTVCLLDPVANQLQCARANGSTNIIDLPDATNYVCLSPDDFQTLINYAKEKCK